MQRVQDDASPAYAACADCILTPAGSARLGPIVDYGGFVGKNVAGCIELADPGSLPCATAVQALTGCELKACSANCPVGDAPSLAAYYQCADYADGTGCATYSAMASCEGAELDGGAASICGNAAFKDFYDAVVPLFCGRRATLVGDAGSAYPPFPDASVAGEDAGAGGALDAMSDAEASASDATGLDAGAD